MPEREKDTKTAVTRLPKGASLASLLEATRGHIAASGAAGKGRVHVITVSRAPDDPVVKAEIAALRRLAAAVEAEPPSKEVEEALFDVLTCLRDKLTRKDALLSQITTMIPGAIEMVRSAEASQRGAQKQLKNPEAVAKAAAKVNAKALWLEREGGKHPKLRTEEQFAMEVLRRWPVLTSIGNVKAWSTAWRKENKRKS